MWWPQVRGLWGTADGYGRHARQDCSVQRYVRGAAAHGGAAACAAPPAEEREHQSPSTSRQDEVGSWGAKRTSITR
jgi:hypothetical protein